MFYLGLHHLVNAGAELSREPDARSAGFGAISWHPGHEARVRDRTSVMNTIEFGVLGPLQVTVDGAAAALGTPKQRAVLAMLVINRNRPVGIESLITAAWEQWPPSEARASLHAYVSNLRRMLGDARSMLANAPPGYRLTVGDSACDIGRFVL